VSRMWDRKLGEPPAGKTHRRFAQEHEHARQVRKTGYAIAELRSGVAMYSFPLGPDDGTIFHPFRNPHRGDARLNRRDRRLGEDHRRYPVALGLPLLHHRQMAHRRQRWALADRPWLRRLVWRPPQRRYCECRKSGGRSRLPDFLPTRRFKRHAFKPPKNLLGRLGPRPKTLLGHSPLCCRHHRSGFWAIATEHGFGSYPLRARLRLGRAFMDCASVS
jgi:hypothetical protein